MFSLSPFLVRSSWGRTWSLRALFLLHTGDCRSQQHGKRTPLICGGFRNTTPDFSARSRPLVILPQMLTLSCFCWEEFPSTKRCQDPAIYKAPFHIRRKPVSCVCRASWPWAAQQALTMPSTGGWVTGQPSLRLSILRGLVLNTVSGTGEWMVGSENGTSDFYSTW